MKKLLAAFTILVIVVAARAGVSPSGGSLITFNQVGGVFTLIPPNSLTSKELDFFTPYSMGVANAFLETDGNGNLFWSNESLTGVTMAGALDVLSYVSAWSFNGNLSSSTYQIAGQIILSVGTGVGAEGAVGNLMIGVSAAPLIKGTAYDDTIVGNWAGQVLTTGYENTFFGNETATTTTTGHNNVAVGDFAGSGYVSGINPTDNTTTQFQNTYVGSNAGSNLLTSEFSTTVHDNTMVGYYAGLQTGGAQNTLLGSQAGSNSLVLNADTLHNDDVAVGFQSLQPATGHPRYSAQNVFVGSVSGGGGSMTGVTGNVGVGYHSLYSLTTGQRNTALGFYAGNGIATETNNTLVGASTVVGSGTTGAVAVGFQATVSASSAIELGSGTNSTAQSLQLYDKNLLFTEFYNLSGSTANIQTQINNITSGGGAVNSIAATAPLAASSPTGAVTISVNTASATSTGVLTAADWSVFNGKQSALSQSNLTGQDTLSISNAPKIIGGSAAVITITTAATSTNGILTQTDWNTFNGKEPAQTKGTISSNTTQLTVGSGSNATVGPNVTLTITTATASTTGLLTSTDWSTFNGKQATVSVGALDAQSANAQGLALVGNVLSQQSADATHPGLVNTATQTLAGAKTFSSSVNTSDGNAYQIGGSSVLGVGTGVAAKNTLIGISAAASLIASTDNTIIGYQAAASYTRAAGVAANTIVGSGAYGSSTGSASDTVVGYQALNGVTAGSGNVAIGYQAGKSIRIGNNNIVIGYTADVTSTSTNAIAIGNGAVVSQGGAIELGAGTNSTANTLQFVSYNFLDQNGNMTMASINDAGVATLGATTVSTLQATSSAKVATTLTAATVNVSGLSASQLVETDAGENLISKTFASHLSTPTFQSFTALSSCTVSYWTATISGLTTAVVAGATYLSANSAVSFTATYGTATSGSTTLIVGENATTTPSCSGTLRKTAGTGQSLISISSCSNGGTYYTPSPTPLWLHVRGIGAGGGGGSSGTSGAGNGATGGNTTFGTSLLTGNGGSPGTANGDNGGLGGSATVTAPAIGFPVTGGQGGAGGGLSLSTIEDPGGMGGGGALGGAGSNGGSTNAGQSGGAGAINTGGGGGGAGSANNTGSVFVGAGGGAGGYFDAVVPSPSASYSFQIGACGAPGAIGGGGNGGGLGGNGAIYIEEHYQ